MQMTGRAVVGGGAAVVVLVAVALGVALASWVPYPRADPMGSSVEARRVHGLEVFTVPGGHTVDVFVAAPQHLDGEALWWCPHEGVFFGPAHGELFSRDGVAFAGPAHHDLDRLAVERLSDGAVRIDDAVSEGQPADTSGPPDEVLGRYLTPVQVDSYRRATTPFCADPITMGSSNRT